MVEENGKLLLDLLLKNFFRKNYLAGGVNEIF
jgi:hypothetical protein